MRCAIVTVLAALAFCVPVSAQTTWYVDDDNCPGPGTGTELDPFCLIQDAIDAASDDDEIIIALGLYTEDTDLLGKDLHVRCADPLNPAVVAGTFLLGDMTGFTGDEILIEGFSFNDGTVTAFTSIGSTAIVTIAHCVFTNADCIAGGNGESAGTLTLNVDHCEFRNNTTDSYALRLSGTDVTGRVTHCDFHDIDNTAILVSRSDEELVAQFGTVHIADCAFDNNAIGIRIDSRDPIVTDCAFTNHSHAIQVYTVENFSDIFDCFPSRPTILRCSFDSNTVDESRGITYGAGIDIRPLPLFCENASGEVRIIECEFLNNTADFGAAVSNQGWRVTIANSMFAGNGSGIMRAVYNAGHDMRIVNSVFSGNGIAVGNSLSRLTMENCTLANNFIGAASSGDGDEARAINCIAYANTNVGIGGFVSVTYSDVQEGTAGVGNINTDPMFVDPDGPDNVLGTADDDLRLMVSSPCIDAGDGDSILVGFYDAAENLRITDDPASTDTGIGPPIDMGAYEYQPDAPTPCPGDTNGDGFVDLADLLNVLSNWGADCE